MKLLTLDILSDWRYDIEENYQTMNCSECGQSAYDNNYEEDKKLYGKVLLMASPSNDCKHCGVPEDDEEAMKTNKCWRELSGTLMFAKNGESPEEVFQILLRSAK